MRWLIYLFTFFLLSATTENCHAQFWKRKDHYTKPTTGKVTEPDGDVYRDAFVRKSSKGPNIKTTKKPIFRSKKKMYKHSTSRKTKKPGSKKFFKPKYSKAKVGKKSGDNFSRNARKTKKNAQKGEGNSNGIFRGRKR